MWHSTVEIEENTVAKTSAPDLMRVEVEKTRRAYEIGKDCGLFRVPKVLEHDETAGRALFERLDSIRPVREAVPWGKQYIALAETLGTSLAIIHRELTLPDEMRIPLPTEFALPHNEVFLHGDLSVDNVLVGPSWPPIVIIDWQFTPGFGGRATFGSRYFDIMWFMGNLIRRSTPRFLLANPVRPVAKAFMESYCQEVGLSWDPNEFAAYAKRSLKHIMLRGKRVSMRGSRLRTLLFWPRSESIGRTFIASLEQQTKAE